MNRRLLPWSGVLAFLCMAPFVIPGIVLAIGFYAAYAPPPMALYGTAALVVLAFTTRFLPIAYTKSDAAMRSINPEMEEAVRILGGRRLTALRKVLAPLLSRSLVGGWILVFIPATRELSAAIFLVGPNTRVISVMLFDLSGEGNFEVLSRLGVILLVATVVIAGIGSRVIGRDFMLRRLRKADVGQANAQGPLQALWRIGRRVQPRFGVGGGRIRLAARAFRLWQDDDACA